MCKFSSKSGGVPFQPLSDLTWNDPMFNFQKICMTSDMKMNIVGKQKI